MRFWGKIKGTEYDYFIAEGKVDAGEAADGGEEGTEPRGTGCNEYVYWICNNLLETWIQLPDIKPS